MKPVSGKYLAKLAEARGWVLLRSKGSHYHYAQAGRPGIVTIPIHGNHDLKPRTQRNIMCALGLTEADL